MYAKERGRESPQQRSSHWDGLEEVSSGRARSVRARGELAMVKLVVNELFWMTSQCGASLLLERLTIELTWMGETSELWDPRSDVASELAPYQILSITITTI